MDPTAYVNVYLNLTVWLNAGGTVRVAIKNYHQGGLGDQSKRAQPQGNRVKKYVTMG